MGYREWYGRFATINISKYEHFTRKINKTYSLLVRPLWFLVFSAVSSLLYHHCYSCKKGKASLKQQKSQKTKILFRVKILNSSSRNLRLLPTFRGRKNRLSFIRLTQTIYLAFPQTKISEKVKSTRVILKNIFSNKN